MPVTVLKRGNETNFSITLHSSKEKFMFLIIQGLKIVLKFCLIFFFLLTWYIRCGSKMLLQIAKVFFCISGAKFASVKRLSLK